MESLSSKNKNVKYLLCVIDVFTKYAWVKPLKDKKGETVLNDFIEVINESNRKPNKLWVNQGREFYNKLVQELLDNNNIFMYSIHKSLFTFVNSLEKKSPDRTTLIHINQYNADKQNLEKKLEMLIKKYHIRVV